MASAKKTTAAAVLSASAIAMLAAIASANPGPMHIPNTEDAKALMDGGYVNVDTSNVNDDGAAATLTEKGKTFMDEQNKAGAAGGDAANAGAAQGDNTASGAAKPTFVIKQRALPVKSKGGRGGALNLYPFDDLPAPEAGQEPSSFFVPATEKRPEPWKSLSSTVSSANSRYATKTGEKNFTNAKGEEKTRATYDYSRRFEIFETEEDGVKGALIARTK